MTVTPSSESTYSAISLWVRFVWEAGGKMAASASLNIKVKGHGGHGGMPHQAVDAIVAASAIVMNLQTMASRELDANNPAVITIGTMPGGDS